MGLVYLNLSTFGLLFMTNVGKYTMHGWYGLKEATLPAGSKNCSIETFAQ